MWCGSAAARESDAPLDFDEDDVAARVRAPLLVHDHLLAHDNVDKRPRKVQQPRLSP